MGNSASANQRHSANSPHPAAHSRPQPRRRPSLDLPDLAHSAAPPATAVVPIPSRPPASAPIAIPQPVPHPHASTSYHPPVLDDRDILPLDSAMADVLIASPVPDHLHPHPHARPANRHIRGAPIQYNSTRSFAHPQQPPHVPPQAFPSRPDPHSAFVPEDVHSTIPLALKKAQLMRDDELLHPGEVTARREPTVVCITYHGPGKTVDLIRAGDANWKRKQSMEYDSESQTWSAWVPLLPGTHHIRFIVDGNIISTADNLPTAVDDNGTIANYVAVPISGFTPQTARALHRRAVSAKREDSFFGHGRERDPSTARAKSKSRHTPAPARNPSRTRPRSSSIASTSSTTSTSDSDSEPRWTTTLPWQLECAAEEEEMWLAQQAQIQSSQIHGYPQNIQRMLVPPQHPQAPQLPRHLEKLIMNQRTGLGGAGSGANGTGAGRRYQYGALAMTTTDIVGGGGVANGGASAGVGGVGADGNAAAGAPSTINLPITTASGTNIFSKGVGAGMSIAMTKAASPGHVSPESTAGSRRGREASPAPSNSTITARESSVTRPSSSKTPSITTPPIPESTSTTSQYVYAPPLTSDDTSVLPVPSHVVLSHLGTSAIRNAMIAVCDTTRYRKKYLTVVYYKPA